jgi:aldose 1-epimerase
VFGYHPYLRLPGAPRAAWEVTLPVRSHSELDERGIPTGATTNVTVPPGPLDDRVYDDLFPRLDDEPVFALEGAGRRLEVRFEQGYPVAQMYAPKGEEFICFEPMTAPTDALARGGGDLRLAQPGSEFTARFSIAVVAG